MSERNSHRHLAVVAPVAAAADGPARGSALADRSARGSSRQRGRAFDSRGAEGEGVSPADEAELLLVGDLAKAVGKTVRAIHLYEELGLVRAHERSKGRYRLFTPAALVRVRWIIKLQNLGLSLSDIQALVRGQNDAASAKFAAMRLRDVYIEKLNETRAKFAELKALEAELEASLAFLATCHSACESEASVRSCPTCERHPEQAHPPDLVAGSRVN